MKKMSVAMAISMLFTGHATAEHSRESLKEAVTLLRANKTQEAYDHLLKEHDSKSNNPQAWFLLGMAAKKVGDYGNAEIYFNKVIELDPNAVRVKLEMAELAYLRGNLEGAKNLLLDAKTFNPPEQVAETIDRFVVGLSANATNKKEHKNWRLWASLGWLYDTNANAGPNVDRVTFYGLPFTLSSSARASEDSAVRARFGLDHLASISTDMGWQSNVSLSWTDYKDLNNLDTLYMSASTGLAWKQGNNGVWSVPVVLDWVNFGYDNSYFSYSYGVAPQYRYKLNAQTTLGAAASLSERKYDILSNREVLAWGFSPSIRHVINPETVIRLRANVTKEQSGLQYFSNDEWGVGGDFHHNMTDDLLVGLQGSYSRAYFNASEPAYTEARNESTIRAGINMVYHIDMIDADAIASAIHTKNNSNIPLYNHSREQIGLSFRKALNY